MTALIAASFGLGVIFALIAIARALGNIQSALEANNAVVAVTNRQFAEALTEIKQVRSSLSSISESAWIVSRRFAPKEKHGPPEPTALDEIGMALRRNEQSGR